MPRIGRSFPPQWSEPNIGGAERALGPEPPQVLAPVVTTVSVNLATGVYTNQRRAQQRRPSILRGTPIFETGVSDTLAAYAASIGPQPPLIIGPAAPPPPPVETTVTVASVAVQSRRQTDTQRFPLQGWAGDGHLATASPTGSGATLYRGGGFTNSPTNFGNLTNPQVAVPLYVPWNTSSFVLAVALRRAANPTDNAIISIQGNGPDDFPDGDVLATFSVLGSSLSAAVINELTATFTCSLVAGQKYWVVFSRDGATSATNFYQTGLVQADTSAGTLIANNRYRDAVFGTIWTHSSLLAYWKVTPLGGTNAGSPLLRRNLGPKPPEYTITISPDPVVSVVLEPSLTSMQAVAARVARQQRAPHSFLLVVQQLAQPPPVVTTITVATVKTRPRRTTSLYTQAPYLSPLAVVTTPGQLAVAAHEVRRRPRLVQPELPLVIVTTTTFIAPPVSVTLQDNRVRGFGRRHFPSVALNPPTVLQTFAGPEVLLQAIQTRVQRQRRRLPGSFLSPPATLEPETVALAERQIRVTLTHTRPRPTVSRHIAPLVVASPEPPTLQQQTLRVVLNAVARRTSAPARPGFTVEGQLVTQTGALPRFYDDFSAGSLPPIWSQTLGGAGALFESGGTLHWNRALGTPAEMKTNESFFFGPRSVLSIDVPGAPLDDQFYFVHDFFGIGIGFGWLNPHQLTILGFLSNFTVDIGATATTGQPKGLRVRWYDDGSAQGAFSWDYTLDGSTWVSAFREPASDGGSAWQGFDHLRLVFPGGGALTDSLALDNPTLGYVVTPSGARRRMVDVWPPAVIASQTVQDVISTTSVAGNGSIRHPGRRTHSFLAPPSTLAAAAAVYGAAKTPLVRSRPRPTAAMLAPPATLEPESVQIAERQVRVVPARTRPRHTLGTKLGYVTYPATSEIAVALVRTRPRPTRHALTAITYPQAGVGFTHLVRTRPRPTSKFVAPPSTLQPYAVTVAEDTIRVAVARTRPRPTTRRLTPPTVLQTFAAPRTPLVRTRPRHTVAFVAPPATLEPEAVSLAERELRIVLTRTRPRHTVGTRLSYTVYPQTSKIAVALVRARPRLTVHALTAVSYPATSEITVVLARIRPRPTTRRLSPPIFYAATSEIAVTLSRTRPRPTRRFLAPPTTLQTFGPPVEAEIAVRVPADDRARRKPRSFQIQPVTNAATSEISVTLTRIRPRPTRRFLTAVTYPATSEIAVALVRARSRPLTRYIAAPATLQPYSVTIAEDTVRVAAVRTRPRHTLGTRLNPPTVLRTFAGPAVTLTHTRPRPTLRRLAPPTVIRVPSVEQREDTLTVALVHTRPRPTEKFIVPPVVRTFPPVVTTLLPAHVVKTRPRPTTRFLRPPTVVIPLPTLRMQTVTVATVRTRPRPTRHSLTPLAFYRQTSKIQVVLARTRPRPTTKRLSPPIFYKQTSEITVLVARTRPRQTTRSLTAVRYEQTSEIAVALTRIRPRPTRHFVAPPTVLQTFGPPVEVEIAVRTPLEDRRRRSRSFAIRPVAYAAASEIAVTLARARPRPTRSLLRPPTAVRAFVAAPVTVVTARTRPRRTHSFLLPPTAVKTFAAQPILVATVAARPRPTTTRLAPPKRLRPVETTIRVALARTRPRHVRSNLTPVAVITEPPTVTTLTVALTQARPRPTRNLLAAPATLRRVVVFVAEPIRVTTVTARPPRTRAEFVGGPVPELISLCGWTSGEVVAATDSAGSSILVSGTQGGAVVVASTESEVTPVAQSKGEDSATGRTEGMDKLAGT